MNKGKLYTTKMNLTLKVTSLFKDGKSTGLEYELAVPKDSNVLFLEETYSGVRVIFQDMVGWIYSHQYYSPGHVFEEMKEPK